MSFLTSLPGDMESAASGLAGIGTTVATANGAAAPALNGVVPPAPEPASILLAMMFQVHGGMYQVTQGIGTAMHTLFVSTLAASAGAYDATEVATAVTLI